MTLCTLCKKEFEPRQKTNTLRFCSRACKAIFFSKRDGYIPPNQKGKFVGEKSPVWVKDRTKLQRYNDTNKDRRSSVYRYWRKQVYSRDNWKCRMGNKDCEGRLEAHHILSYTDYPELRYEINNGITLCHAHHPRKREDEAKLSPYFKKLVAEMN